MVLFFIALLGISIVGMSAVLYLKRYELTTGKVFLAGARPRTHSFFHTLFVLVERVLPALLREQGAKAADWSVSFAHYATAKGVLFVEHSLEQVLHTVRQKTAPERVISGEVSPFLREVADHKKQLLRRSRKARVIVED